LIAGVFCFVFGKRAVAHKLPQKSPLANIRKNKKHNAPINILATVKAVAFIFLITLNFRKYFQNAKL